MSGQVPAVGFKMFMERHQDVVLQTHDYPDPDAIAAAYGLSVLISTLGGSAVICHTGAITRAITQEMISILQIPILPAVLAPGRENSIIVVDGRIRNDNVTKFPGKYIGEIDHHPGEIDPDGDSWHDVRPHYGSTSSIVGEYWRDLGLPIPREVATALAIGLNTDTQRLLRGVTGEDIEIYAWLFRHADREYLQYVLNNNIERADFAWFSKAIANLEVQDRFGMTDLGEMDNPALLAIICDFLLTAREINVMLTLAQSGERVLLSMRSESPSHAADRIVQQITTGIGSGGGHRSMAAGSCQFSDNSPPEFVKRLIRERFFGAARCTAHP